MLSAIVQKVTGQPVVDYLRPRLFEPLGIINPASDWEQGTATSSGTAATASTAATARTGSTG
jgi:CubicO group peptidase (beta-lactamase class C family)